MDEQVQTCSVQASNHTDELGNGVSIMTGTEGIATTCASPPTMNLAPENNETVGEVKCAITEGHRMHQLRKGLERTVDKCVTAGKYSLFMSHLPALGNKNPRALKAIQSQYLQKLKENIQCEIETMFKEENMAALMGELDQLIASTPDTDVGAWRPSADVKENLRPHVMCVKEKQKKRLQETFLAMESETKQLQDLVTRKRQKLQNTIKLCKSNIDKQTIDG